MDVGPLALLTGLMIFVTKKVVDLIKEILPNNIANKVVQGIALAVGVGLAALFAISDFGEGIAVVNGKSLDDLNAAGVVIYGLGLAAGAGVTNDAIERRNPDASPDGP